MKLLISIMFAVLALIVGSSVAVVVTGQSGRKSPPPSPTLTSKSEAEFKPDPNRSEYQLVFSKVPEAEKIKGPWRSRDQRVELRASTFSDELTEIAALGYRLSSIALSPRVAVMRRDEHQYEYEVLQIASRSRVFPNDPNFDRTYEPWARKGFRVFDYIVLDDTCNVSIWDNTNNVFDGTVDCTYSSLVVLERQKDSVMPAHRYQIVHVRPTFSKDKLQTGLGEELGHARRSKLYPTHMLTRFQLLTQSPIGTEDVASEEYETEIVTGDVNKKINVLAQQGYRLILRPIWFEAAVMHRSKATTTATSYVWISGKKLEEEIRRLQQQGMIYRMNYGCEGRSMIFELPSVIDDKRREYRVLRIDLKEKRDASRTVEYELLPGTTAAIQEFTLLTKQGFEVKDFFDCYSGDKNRTSGLKILLERVSRKDGPR